MSLLESTSRDSESAYLFDRSVEYYEVNFQNGGDFSLLVHQFSLLHVFKDYLCTNQSHLFSFMSFITVDPSIATQHNSLSYHAIPLCTCSASEVEEVRKVIQTSSKKKDPVVIETPNMLDDYEEAQEALFHAVEDAEEKMMKVARRPSRPLSMPSMTRWIPSSTRCRITRRLSV